jgi:membrane protease YdiL (CAAX protease family)
LGNESPLVLFKRRRVFLDINTELKQTYFWQFGSTLALIITVIFAIVGAFVFVAQPALLNPAVSPTAVFYIFFFLFGGVLGPILIKTADLSNEKIVPALFGALVCLALLIPMSILFQFLSTLQLLETPSPSPIITWWQNLIFQMVFVAISEELVFRHTGAWIVERILQGRVSPERARQIGLLIVMPVVFGVMHFAAYELNFWNIVNAVVAGVILGWVRMGYARKNADGSPKMKEVTMGLNTIQVPDYYFGGLLATVLGHLAYNALIISKLMVIHF